VEGRWEIVQEDVGYTGVIVSFIAPRSNNQGGKAVGLHMHGKKT
jgi:hypothetical protein